MNYIKKNIWIKITSFNSLAVFSRLFSAWAINKLIAVYIGPQGTGLAEQFRNFLQALQGISVLGIQEGITKFTAEFSTLKKQMNSFLYSSLKMVLIWSVVLGLIIAFFSDKINTWLFPGYDFSRIVFLTGILLPLLAFNLIFIAVLKGLQAYKKIVFINVSTNILGILLAYILIKNYYLEGALLLILGIQILQFIITAFLLLKSRGRFHFRFSGKMDFGQISRLSPFVIMAVVSAIVIPLFNILIRNHIFTFFDSQGAVQAGYWDAAKKIGNLFLSLITPVFGMYYFPQLAKLSNSSGFQTEIKKFVIQVLPWFTIGLILIYLFRYPLIRLFFSEAYFPMESLFPWQLAGEYFKILSLLIAYLMLAKAHLKLYIISELGFWVTYYLLTLVLLNYYGLKGVSMAYFIAYVCYFFFLVIVYYKYLFYKNIPIK